MTLTIEYLARHWVFNSMKTLTLNVQEAEIVERINQSPRNEMDEILSQMTIIVEH